MTKVTIKDDFMNGVDIQDNNTEKYWHTEIPSEEGPYIFGFNTPNGIISVPGYIDEYGNAFGQVDKSLIPLWHNCKEDYQGCFLKMEENNEK